MTGSHALAVTSVRKCYGGAWAVDDVSFEVAHGEFMTLLGPSGSGKTTTLRMVAGFIDCDSGAIVIDGQDVTRVPAHKRGTGMVFQHYALFPHMNCVDNVAFPLRMRGVGRKEAASRAEQMLARMHLDGFGPRTPAQMSGGQQQRVALARALVFGPRLLLMDEPLGALDKKLRDALQIEIVQLCKELNMTCIYVTHDQEEALAMSDRIAIYSHGRIEQLGTGEDLYERPTSLFVARFIGSSNVLHGVVRRDSGCLVTSVGALALPPPDPRIPAVPDRADGVLVVRPERVSVHACAETGESAAPGPDAAGVEGVLQEATYLGSVVRYVARLNDGTAIQARVPATSAARVLPGERVRMAWAPDQTVLLPAGTTTRSPGDADEAGLDAGVDQPEPGVVA